MSIINVSSGKTSSGYIVSSGNVLAVLSGGSAYNTSLQGGTEWISSGGTSISDFIDNSGLEIVLSGGFAVSTSVNAGGQLTVLDGAKAVKTTVNGNEHVLSGGVVSNTKVYYGKEFVSAGGLAISSNIYAGTELVLAGGLAVSSEIEYDDVIFSGGTSSAASVYGSQLNSGITNGTQLLAPGSMEVIFADALANNTMAMEGNVIIKSGGTASGTVLIHSTEVVSAGGTAIDDTISSGSIVIISPGATDTGVTVSSGGYVVALPGSIVNETEVMPGGTLFAGSTGVLFVTTWHNPEGYSPGIFSAASATRIIVTPESNLFVMSGGVVTSASVLYDIHDLGGPPTSRTELYVLAGGTVIDTSLGSSGDLYISQGGLAISTTTLLGERGEGTELVLAAGIASETTIDGGLEIVSSGGISYGATVNSPYPFEAGLGELDVSSGGLAIGTTVNSGGAEYVASGGVTSGSTISLGGTEYILAGAVDEGSVVLDGTEIISSGGTVYVTTNNQAGFLIMSSGSTKAIGSGIIVSSLVVTSVMTLEVSGVAKDASIYNHGTENVLQGGNTVGTVISSGGELKTFSGGIDSNSIVQPGGTEIVLAGGTVYISHSVKPMGLTVNSGGTELIVSSLTLSSVVVTSGISLVVFGSEVSGAVTGGGTEVISAGGMAEYMTLSGGHTHYVSSDGKVIDTNVDAEGTQILQSGGSANNTEVTDAGVQIIFNGAAAVNTLIASGGLQYIYGDASGTLVKSAGVETVFFGGNASNSVVSSGGKLMVFGIAVDTNVEAGGTEIIGVGGTDVIDSTKKLVGVYVSGGTELLSASDISGVISLVGSNNTLVIDGGSLPTALITGINSGSNDALLISDVTFVSGGSVTVSGDVVTITDGGSSYLLNVQPSSDTPKYELLDQAGTLEMLVPCYAEGTRIMTEHGEMAIEDISIGEKLVMARANGPATRKVVWTGRRRVDLTRHPEREQVLPVRILASAFGPGLPRRDLRVSPRHAIFFDGCLFEAISLVNGGTVVQEYAATSITYYHIELDQHDVVLAEGMPAESYLNQGHRGMFEGERTIMLHPDFQLDDKLEGFCVPVIRSGAELAAVRTKILARAAILGFVPIETSSLGVFVKSRRLKPVAFGHYLLPENTTLVDLRSAVGFADQTGPVISDTRALGVALGQVLLTTLIKTQSIDLSKYHSGLYETLDGVTWTNGSARLAIPPFKGPAILVVKPIRHVDRLYRASINVQVLAKRSS
jgi:autotransporter passenger strand-loop-strand repeat protein